MITINKIFIKGVVTFKYFGESRSTLSSKYEYYTIEPYDIQAYDLNVINEKEYEDVQGDDDLSFDILKDVSIHQFDGASPIYFKEDIFGVKLSNIKFQDVVKEQKETFGTVTSSFVGYFTYQEKVDIGKPHIIKEEDDVKQPQVNNSPSSSTSPITDTYGCVSILAFIFTAVIAFALIGMLLSLGGPILLWLLILLVVAFFSSFLIRILTWILRTLSLLLILVFLFSVFSIFKHISTAESNTLKNERYEHTNESKIGDIEREIESIDNTTKDTNYVITHRRIWKNYDGTVYQGDLAIKATDYLYSKRYRNNQPMVINNFSDWSKLYYLLHTNDENKLVSVYRMFDSIRVDNSLNKIELANVIVSCVQDIPYTLILDNYCQANLYEDKFIKDYLSNSSNDCMPLVTYGVQSPVEFIGNLKGDCDTRTLFLFTVFHHFGYDVAIFNSELYQHSILGIVIPAQGKYKYVNNKKYFVWEATSPGMQVGMLDPSVSNMNYWNTYLINN